MKIMVKLVKLFPLVISRPASQRMKCVLFYAKWGIIPEENLRACMYHDG